MATKKKTSGGGAERQAAGAPVESAETPAAKPAETKPPGLQTETVSIDSLSLDPRNARTHSAANLAAITASLKQFGQQKPIVVDGDGVIRAGNGTFTAAKALGWTEISVVRSKLTGAAATAFAIADNRTAELADWDTVELERQLEDLNIDGFDAADLGFDEKQLEALLSGDVRNAHGFASAPPKSEKTQPVVLGEQFLVVITCRDEQHQLELLQRFETEGLECKAPVA